MKLCMSIWMTDALGYQVDIENEWYSRNQSWNICNKRKDDYFHILKEAETSDQDRFVYKDESEGYVNFQHTLHIFLDNFLKKYNMILESFTVYIVDIRLQNHHSNKVNNITEDTNSIQLINNSTKDKKMNKKMNII